MIGDLLGGVIEGYLSSRTPSQRWQVVARMLMGAVGCMLAVVGAVMFAVHRPDVALPLRATIVLFFLSLGAFFLFNVLLARRWRWPAVLFAASFVAMFVTRLVWGA